MDASENETAVGRGLGRGKLNRLLLKVFGPASVGVPTPRGEKAERHEPVPGEVQPRD